MKQPSLACNLLDTFVFLTIRGSTEGQIIDMITYGISNYNSCILNIDNLEGIPYHSTFDI